MIRKIGRHIVRHGDVHNAEGIAELVGDTQADIFYTDPPWGTGTMKYFDTLNIKSNEGATPTGNYDVDAMLDILMYYAKNHSKGWVVVEFGKQWVDQVIERAEKAGLIYCDKVETLYANNLKMDIMFFRVDAYKAIDLSSIYHLKGYKCIKTIFALLKPKAGGDRHGSMLWYGIHSTGLCR